MMRLSNRFAHVSYGHMIKLIAKYDGYCEICGVNIIPGDKIYWKHYHTQCIDCHHARNYSFNKIIKKNFSLKSQKIPTTSQKISTESQKNSTDPYIIIIDENDNRDSLVDYIAKYGGFANFDHYQNSRYRR